MNIFADIESRIVAALETLKAEGKLPDLAIAGIEATPPRDPSHGDVASNAAMVLAKAARMKPRDIADALAAKLMTEPDISKAEVAGPGFLNLTFAPGVWHKVIPAILKADATFGKTDLGKNQRVNVEYVSANPTGPMHVGHCRGAVFGDALASLLAFVGYDVTREYYVNDAGGQIAVLAQSALLRYREALGEDIGAIPEGLYPGDYLKPVGAALAKAHGKKLLAMPDAERLPIVQKTAIDMMLVEIKTDLAVLNIKHDVFFSEASLKHGNVDRVADAIADLEKRGHIYNGRLEKPKGHDGDEWEDREQTLFRSTAFGDDTDRALMKSDGGYTYFAGDVAYHHDKFTRGFAKLINVFGADHIGYIPRLLAVLAAYSGGKTDPKKWTVTGGTTDFEIRVVQLVKLMKNGEPFKMSKRSGTFVTLRDVVDEVGSDPVRFMMLYRKELEPLDFDLAKVIEQSKENPVFYVQMAHARAKSVFRNVKEVFPDLNEASPAVHAADLSRLSDPSELEMIKKLAFFPVMIAGAAKAHEPHRVAFYLYELASSFHGQWARGNDSPHLRYIQADDKGLTAARLALVAVHAQVLAAGLAILGVGAPEELR
jgi:arginyl-tRNA synthetase